VSEEPKDKEESFLAQNGVVFEFSVAKDKTDRMQHIVMRYGQAQIHLGFLDTEIGSACLGRLVSAMPLVVKQVRREVLIRQETAGVEDELRALLDTEGDEEV
jgi:hypothetical protein